MLFWIELPNDKSESEKDMAGDQRDFSTCHH